MSPVTAGSGQEPDARDCWSRRQCRIGLRGYWGVDDFAFRKGRTYDTILVDVEAGRVVDVLPDRTAKTLAAG